MVILGIEFFEIAIILISPLSKNVVPENLPKLDFCWPQNFSFNINFYVLLISISVFGTKDR